MLIQLRETCYRDEFARVLAILSVERLVTYAYVFKIPKELYPHAYIIAPRYIHTTNNNVQSGNSLYHEERVLSFFDILISI